MPNISIWYDHSGQSGPGDDGDKGVLRIPQSSIITGRLSSDCLVSYPGHSLRESYPSAEMQSVYSAAPADLATKGSRSVSVTTQQNLGKSSNKI